MSDDYNENILKGRIAESIVEQMFSDEGYQVYRFGYESILQNLRNIRTQLNDTETGKKIFSMPDFIIVKNGFAHFIEVKYRSKDPDPKNSEFQELAQHWPDVHLLFVLKNRPHFQIANIKDFTQNNNLYELNKYRYVRVHELTVEKFSKFVVNSFSD